jgi:hypothetical protein
MKKSTLKYIFKRLALIILIGALALCGTITVWICLQTKTFSVRGHVEDGSTGNRIPKAKVIVSAWDHGIWDASPHKYGILTDETGEFSLSDETDYWVSHIDIEASSPNGKYVEYRAIKDEYVVVAVRDLAVSKQSIGVLRYKTFSGHWAGPTQWQEE